MENNEKDVISEETTFDDLLKNPKYQADFDRKLEGARKKWEAKWKEETEAAKNEAERLAKLSETERFEDEINKLKKQNEDLIRSQNASALKDEAIKIATSEGVDVKFLELFDFTRETADTVKSKIALLKENLDSAVTTKVNERLVQPSPKEVHSEGISKEKAYLDNKYKNNRFYKK